MAIEASSGSIVVASKTNLIKEGGREIKDNVVREVGEEDIVRQERTAHPCTIWAQQLTCDATGTFMGTGK